MITCDLFNTYEITLLCSSPIKFLIWSNTKVVNSSDPLSNKMISKCALN